MVTMTGAADILSQGLAAEWLGSNQNSVQALANSGNTGMHVLPLSIKLEKFTPFAETEIARLHRHR
jgi:hypothetical protein